MSSRRLATPSASGFSCSRENEADLDSEGASERRRESAKPTASARGFALACQPKLPVGNLRLKRERRLEAPGFRTVIILSGSIIYRETRRIDSSDPIKKARAGTKQVQQFRPQSPIWDHLGPIRQTNRSSTASTAFRCEASTACV